MNLSNLSSTDNIILKILDKYYNLKVIGSYNELCIPNDNDIVFYTNGNYIQASDDIHVEVVLCNFTQAFSDYQLCELKDDETIEYYLYSRIMQQITNLDLQMMQLTYGLGLFVPIMNSLTIEKEIVKYTTLVKYAIGGYCRINKEEYYEAQKNQQNKML